MPNSISSHSPIYPLLQNLQTVIKGQPLVLKKIAGALIVGGHVLLEDFPGTGKTTLAKSLALSIQAQYKRIQFTPDLLPSDILGVSIYNQQSQAFHFQQGPIFTEILLADEINRASPRTQSALLEAMAEGHVSIEGHQHNLPPLFFVIATQNPVEFRGTYPLPEAQMDRFTLQLQLGYVSAQEEVDILTAQLQEHPLQRLTHCLTVPNILHLRSQAARIRVAEELKHYIVQLVSTTRQTTGISMGASPRASIALLKCAQAMALFNGQDYVLPEHVQTLASDVIAHRLVLDPQTKFSGLSARDMVDQIIQKIPVPA